MDEPMSANIPVPHPGEFIKDELEARGWSQRDLAYILGCPEQAVGMIASGRRGISAEMAKSLGEAFDVSAEFFANLQKSYELSLARQPDPGVGKRARLQSIYPVREMIKRGWLQDTDAGMLETQMMRFFEVNRLDEILQIPHAAKKAKAARYDEAEPVQLAWLYRVRQIAKSMVVPTYSEKRLREMCVQFRYLTIDPEEVRHVPKLLSECGVRFMLVEPLPNSKIDGVCTWLDNAPVIALSTRLDKIDNFWFVLRHEMEHALRGDGKKTVLIDEDLGAGSQDADDLPQEEKIANEAAANFCVPLSVMNDFIARKNPFFSERDMLGFARLQQVHPGIVVGQLQWKTKRYDLFRRYLVKVRNFLAPYCMVDGWGQTAPVSL
jgi:HTH-type transcriptional regulator / antitoxin HigA